MSDEARYRCSFSLTLCLSIWLQDGPKMAPDDWSKNGRIGVPPTRPHGDVIVIRPGRGHPYPSFFDWSKNGRIGVPPPRPHGDVICTCRPSFYRKKSILRRCQSRIGDLSGRCESKHDFASMQACKHSPSMQACKHSPSMPVVKH